MHQKNIKYVFSDYLLMQADKNPAVKGRASLTHELIQTYDLLRHMQVLMPKQCNTKDLRYFHSKDYIQQLERQNCQPQVNCIRKSFKAVESEEDEDDDILSEKYGLSFDCPAWHGIVGYASSIAGATMTACNALCKSNEKEQTIIINWTGGWHHAQRDRAAGYCYVNDIVLGILVLRKCFRRILYIDLDVHHGDAVQQAFDTTQHVFTFSMHKYECGFYPGSGSVNDCGFATGKGYAANFPYKAGISGENFIKYFKRITTKIVELYQPDACIVQCGADVIVGDPLGGTNLTPADLSVCLSQVLAYKLPTVILGGGGYHFTNASRYWTLLTALVCEQNLSEDIPDNNEHFLKYGPDYSLLITAEKFVKDLNNESYLENCAQTIENNLQKYNVEAI